jgi:hypothetical protein
VSTEGVHRLETHSGDGLPFRPSSHNCRGIHFHPSVAPCGCMNAPHCVSAALATTTCRLAAPPGFAPALLFAS